MVDIFLMNIGHPRTGTGYMTTVYKSLGLEVGHEVLAKEGISDWAFSFDNCTSWTTPKYTFESFNPQYIIYNVRDPWESIASIKAEKDSLNKRKIYIPELDNYTGYEQDIFSLLAFDKQITNNRKVDAIVRIEYPEDFLKIDFLPKLPIEKYPTKVYNSRSHGRMTPKDWLSISPELIEELDKYCIKYGYPTISSWVKCF